MRRVGDEARAFAGKANTKAPKERDQMGRACFLNIPEVWNHQLLKFLTVIIFSLASVALNVTG